MTRFGESYKKAMLSLQFVIQCKNGSLCFNEKKGKKIGWKCIVGITRVEGVSQIKNLLGIKKNYGMKIHYDTETCICMQTQSCTHGHTHTHAHGGYLHTNKHICMAAWLHSLHFYTYIYSELPSSSPNDTWISLIISVSPCGSYVLKS